MVRDEGQPVKRAVLIAVFLILSAVLCSQLFADEFPLDKSTVNDFDRFFMNSYNETLDNTATVLEVASLLTPAILLTEDTNEYVTIGVMYLETAAMAFGTRTLLKHFVERPRPYIYYDNYPQEDDWNRSFPSGHTLMSFAGASFASYVFCKYNPDSKWRIPVTAASYAIATATAALRVASGNHFVTDVLAGAAIGTAIGIAVPALHTLLADKDMEVSASPFGLVFKKTYK